MSKVKNIEIFVTREDVQELMKYYQSKKKKTSSDREMLAQFMTALDHFDNKD